MNYANDPLWAHKHSMDPYKRQAYESQVMADRAAADRHRTQFDAAATVGSVLILADWFRGRDSRKQAKERKRYIDTRRPVSYDERRAELESAERQLQIETIAAVPQFEVELMQLKARLPVAGTAKTHRSLKGRIDALEALIKDKRLAYATGIDALTMKYSDILTFEAGLAKFN